MLGENKLVHFTFGKNFDPSWLFVDETEKLQLGNCNIWSGMNYSVSNEMKQNE